MKKTILVILISFLLVLGAAAQGLYLDAGIGLGKASTTWEGYELRVNDSVREIGIELGAKVGFAPLRKVPLYIVFDVDAIGHRFSNDGGDYVQFNSYLFGPGLVFYPIDILQIGGSYGISFANATSDDSSTFSGYQKGTAWNIYAALDFGDKGSGTLIGVKYQAATNKFDYAEFLGIGDYGELLVEQNSSIFSIFVRYALR